MKKKNTIAENKPAIEALERERNKLKDILDAMPDGVYISSRQNEIQYINPVLERAFGPVKGRKCYEYFPQSLGGLSVVQESGSICQQGCSLGMEFYKIRKKF